MPVRRETGAGVRSWCRWAGSNYSWPATTGERPVVGPAATGRRADADGAESAESRRPSNLLRLAPAKEVESISPVRRRWRPGPPETIQEAHMTTQPIHRPGRYLSKRRKPRSHQEIDREIIKHTHQLPPHYRDPLPPPSAIPPRKKSNHYHTMHCSALA